MQTTLPDLQRLLSCPACRNPLEGLSCSRCGKAYTAAGAQIAFVPTEGLATLDAEFHAEQVYNSSLRGQLFNIGRRIISSEYMPTDHLKQFLGGLPSDAVVVELGSGPRRLSDRIVNVDLFGFPRVDLVADIAHTPLQDGVADAVILDSVVEHVPDPAAVAAEALRILKPGGTLFCNCPFVFPYHGYPAHYQNLTRDGLQNLFKGFSSCTVKPTFGPMTAWVNLTAESFAVLVSGQNKSAYVVAKGLALLPIFWLKYLDKLFVRSPNAHRIAGMLCAVAVK
jgi:SAM-dependent methyltransferase